MASSAGSIDTAIAGGLTAYAVFSSHFLTLLTDFLLFIVVWLGPWCAIYLVDSWLRRNPYDTAALLNEREVLPQRRRALASDHRSVLGIVCAALWLNAYPPYVAYFSSRNGGPLGSDFSVFIGLFVGGVVYFLLARKSVRAEGDATDVAVAEAAAS